MARPRRLEKADWEAQLAAVSLAGVRPIVHDTLSVGAAAEEEYTITDVTTKRVILFHDASTNTSVFIALNGTASATTLPVVPGAYFVLEVDPADVVHVYNNSGTTVTIYITEIR